MDETIEAYLTQFRDLKITRKMLLDILPQGTLTTTNLGVEIEVCSSHVINLLRQYNLNRTSTDGLLEWVNTVWFSEWFIYNEHEEESKEMK